MAQEEGDPASDPASDEAPLEEPPLEEPPLDSAGPLDEEARSARARELFAAGVGHAQERRWRDAVDAFREALELRTAASIRYNLAAALVELGQARRAHEQLLALEADEEAGENLRELAMALRSRMRSSFGRLRVEVSPELGAADVRLDGDTVPALLLGTPIPLANGEHDVVASRGGETVAQASVTTQPGELTHVVLSAGPVQVVEAPVVTPSEDPPIAEEPLFWLAIGGAAVVVAGVIVLAVVLSSGQGTATPTPGNFQPGLITWP